MNGKKIRNFISRGGDNFDSAILYKILKGCCSDNFFIRQWYYIRQERLMLKYNSYIPVGTKIGKNIIFPHFYGIFISSGATIGNDCVIFQNVTIGSNSLTETEHRGAPHIGNSCYIGAGASIIGGINIGNNVRVGANCVVTQDIPDNATVVMNKPVIISHAEKRNNKFIPL